MSDTIAVPAATTRPVADPPAVPEAGATATTPAETTALAHDEVGLFAPLYPLPRLELVEGHGAMIVGADQATVEYQPATDVSGHYLPVHLYLLAEQGAPMMEIAFLEELARDQVYQFAFFGAPLRLRGATGSPIVQGFRPWLMATMFSKFAGRGGWSLVMKSTNAASSVNCRAGLKRRSKPMVDPDFEDMAFPHDEPAPWAG